MDSIIKKLQAEALKSEIPDSFEIPNSYNLPIHDQGDKMNCTSHAIAGALEFQLSDRFKERTIVDVDDLWEKQKKFGTATEENGDFLESALMIAVRYGIKYRTESGREGTFFPAGYREIRTDKKRGLWSHLLHLYIQIRLFIRSKS